MFAPILVFVRLRLDPSSAEQVGASQDDGIGLRYKQCKAREGQKDEIDLIGHRGLLPEAVTQQCAQE